MAAPTNPYNAIPAGEKQAGQPGKQELFEKLDGNTERAFEVVLAAGVAPGDAAVAVGHRHLGPTVDGSAIIASHPQENLVIGGDGVSGFSTATDVPAGDISFHNGLNAITPRRIRRSDGSNYFGTKTDRKSVFKALIAPINKIKSAGGKGRFTCSLFVKREAAASGVVGGVFRFGLYSSSFISGAYVDIEFDDVTTEYQRLFFVSDQIARPTSLNIRLQWQTQPSDWDTVAEDDIIGYLGGIMVTNGESVPRWDISHLDGGADDYLAAPTDDLIYWWDEVIEEVQQTVA